MHSRSIIAQLLQQKKAHAAGALLKEAVEDLEWSSGSQSIAVYIKRNPTQITMSAQGLGELLIALPVSQPLLPFPAAH